MPLSGSAAALGQNKQRFMAEKGNFCVWAEVSQCAHSKESFLQKLGCSWRCHFEEDLCKTQK